MYEHILLELNPYGFSSISSNTVFGTNSNTIFNLLSLLNASLNFTIFSCYAFFNALTSLKAILRIMGF